MTITLEQQPNGLHILAKGDPEFKMRPNDIERLNRDGSIKKNKYSQDDIHGADTLINSMSESTCEIFVEKTGHEPVFEDFIFGLGYLLDNNEFMAMTLNSFDAEECRELHGYSIRVMGGNMG